MPLHLLPWLRATWVAKGTRMRVPTPGTNGAPHRGVPIGASSDGVPRDASRWGPLSAGPSSAPSSWPAGAGHHPGHQRRLPPAPGAGGGRLPLPAIAILLDNVAIHRSRVVTHRLGEYPQVRLIFGPRYCPHHNPVERIWGAMRTYLANTPVETMTGRVRQVQAFFRERGEGQRLRCASPSRSPWLPEGYAQSLWEAA